MDNFLTIAGGIAISGLVLAIAMLMLLIWYNQRNTASTTSSTMTTNRSRLIKSVAIAGTAASLWFLIPWASTPPGKLLASHLSKDALEMVTWVAGAALFLVTAVMTWRIWDPGDNTTKSPITGAGILWGFAITAICVTAYLVSVKVIDSDNNTPVHKEVNLSKDTNMEVWMNLTTIATVTVPNVNISKEGNQRWWICRKVVQPSRLPFEVKIDASGQSLNRRVSFAIDNDSRYRLVENGTEAVLVRFWRVKAPSWPC